MRSGLLMTANVLLFLKVQVIELLPLSSGVSIPPQKHQLYCFLFCIDWRAHVHLLSFPLEFDPVKILAQTPLVSMPNISPMSIYVPHEIWAVNAMNKHYTASVAFYVVRNQRYSQRGIIYGDASCFQLCNKYKGVWNDKSRNNEDILKLAYDTRSKDNFTEFNVWTKLKLFHWSPNTQLHQSS